MKICIDLGATNVKGALVEDGKLLRTAVTPTQHGNGRGGIVSSLRHTIDELLDDRVQAIAVSSAGDIDENGVCTYATGNLEDFAGFDFVRFARETYRLPCVAANDGMMALLGELRYGGAEIGAERVAMLTLGSGVGGACAERGVLLPAFSMGEGKLGHLTLHREGLPCNCGKRGCIEQYLSGRAINRMAAEHGIPADSLFERIAAGEVSALVCGEALAEELRLALARVHEVFPFEVVILGGGAAEGMEKCASFFTSRAGYPVVFARLGNRAGLLGAYALAEERS